MFTGIIEAIGIVSSISRSGSNQRFEIRSALSHELKVDQSIAHNGVCLTVEAVNADTHQVTAIQETLEKSNLGALQIGSRVNLERCLQVNSRLDGHFVQGHVDGTGQLLSVENLHGSYVLQISFPASFAGLVIEKGSISLNGVSLTIFNVGKSEFSVAIIPYTWDHTNFSALVAGETVNLEFDLVGKYIVRNLLLQQS